VPPARLVIHLENQACSVEYSEGHPFLRPLLRPLLLGWRPVAR